MSKFLLYGNGSFDNLGCEALSISTHKILCTLSHPDITYLTFGNVDDYKIMENAAVIGLKRDRNSFLNLLSSVLCKFKLKKIATAIPNIEVRKKIQNYDIAFSIGGDNYCYDGRERFFRVNNEVRKKTKKMIFWGTSINADALNKATISDLNKFDLIIARETLTYQALKLNHINHVVVVPDPAFVLDVEEAKIHFDFDLNNTVGINLSPLVYSYSNDKEVVRKSLECLVCYVLEKTNLNILFFSHVYGNGNDIDVAKELLSNMEIDKSRICFLEERLHSTEIKGVISKLHSVICARTHASIAAYSTCVPTLVLGYSIKSKGIAKDIFGSYEKHVIPVQNILNVESFLKDVGDFFERNKEEREYLQKTMPEYTAKVFSIKEYLDD